MHKSNQWNNVTSSTALNTIFPRYYFNMRGYIQIFLQNCFVTVAENLLESGNFCIIILVISSTELLFSLNNTIANYVLV